MDKQIKAKYNTWLKLATEDKDLIKELKLLDEEQIFDAFYKDLSFGTAGLRGVIGAGTNRMNIYVVRQATQGLANYLKKEYKNKQSKVAIGYDSRIKSSLFAKEAAAVLASNGIEVLFYKELMPVPCVSYAVRECKCQAGIMITASHNPSKYNGYKVYGNDGCQITSVAANKITKEISLVNPFKVKSKKFKECVKSKAINYIDEEIVTRYIETVKKESVLGKKNIDKNVKIIYSPLNGAGLVPVTRILKESGYKNVKVVRKQQKPNGKFPTCPYPNPEIKEAMELGIKYAKKYNADILVATDPDCDRVGIAVKDKNDFVLLTGNQVGTLLLNYICELRQFNKTMPKEPHAVKTIVTSDMVDEVAKFYKVKLHSVLTGFKYIGDVINNLKKVGKEDSYILGFEESYGYLTGTHVRDKDGVNGVFMIVEMFAYYKSKNISLVEKLNELYKKFGYYLNKLDTFTFEGASGFKKMQEIMASFRKKMSDIAGIKVIKTNDYNKCIDGLPASDVIKFYLSGGSTVTIRPSGTEPKLKLYCSIKAKDEEKAMLLYNKIFKYLKSRFN